MVDIIVPDADSVWILYTGKQEDQNLGLSDWLRYQPTILSKHL